MDLKSFGSLLELIMAFPNENACIAHLEAIRWNGNVVSPFDTASKIYKCAGNKYKCKTTGKYFNACTGTIFEGKKISLQQWFVSIYLFSTHKGISSYKLAVDLKVSQKTGWFILQRLRFALKNGAFVGFMEGVIEVDETFVGGKNKNRHHDKKVKDNQGRSFKDKTPVFGMYCDGKVKCTVVPNTSAAAIQPLIKETVKTDSIIVSDEWWAYNGLANSYNHQVVDHARKQYVNDSGFTSNRMEGFWSHFKRGIIGTYYHASRKHLQGYADEFSFRFNNREQTSNENFNLLLRHTEGKRITYKTLTNG